MSLYYEKLTRHTETGIYFFSYRLIYPAKFCLDRPSQTSEGKPTRQIASTGNRKFKYLNLNLETGQMMKLTLQKKTDSKYTTEYQVSQISSTKIIM